MVAPTWWPLFVALHLFGQALVIYPTVRPNCDWFGIVVKTFPAEKKEVWLTIDDGPDPQSTPQILELLEQFQARATFFVIGARVRAYPQLTRAILAGGHTLGSHTATHPSAFFWGFSKPAAAREIDGGVSAIRDVAGIDPKWFRAPVGLANVFVHRLLSARGIKLVGWSARGFDTVETDVEKVIDNIFRGIRPGAIVLLHERAGRPGTGPANLLVIEKVLARLRDAGYTCVVPVDSQLAVLEPGSAPDDQSHLLPTK